MIKIVSFCTTGKAESVVLGRLIRSGHHQFQSRILKVKGFRYSGQNNFSSVIVDSCILQMHAILCRNMYISGNFQAVLGGGRQLIP